MREDPLTPDSGRPDFFSKVRALARLALGGLMFTVSTLNTFGQSSSLDYPQWRGQNRDGEASAFTAPKLWPENLARKWKVDVGEGYATPIVVGDAVYVFARREGNEVLIALEAKTGKIRWQTDYAAPYTPARPAAAHGAGPKATPLFQDGRLYTVGISGIFSAFDARTGRLLWQKPAPAEHPFFSAASSPAGDSHLVFAHPGNYDPLTAFDADTGDVRWRSTGGGFYASPILVDLAGTRQVVTVLSDRVIGVSIADGRLLWQHPWPGGGGGSTTPILRGDMIIVSGLNAGMTAIRPRLRETRWLVETVWETKDVSLYVSDAVVIGDTVFGLSHRASGQFFALDATTGKVLWLGQPRETQNTAIAKAGDLLFLLNDDAELIVAKANRSKFEALKRYTVADSATWAQPTISGNRIFIRDVTSLALWTFD
jgi:outer membrane protein assembly factor BamB